MVSEGPVWIKNSEQGGIMLVLLLREAVKGTKLPLIQPSPKPQMSTDIL